MYSRMEIAIQIFSLQVLYLFHFRDTDLPQVYARQKECWDTIIQNKTEIPAISIKVYSQDGEYQSTNEFENHLDAADILEVCQEQIHSTSSDSNSPTMHTHVENMEEPTNDNLHV